MTRTLPALLSLLVVGCANLTAGDSGARAGFERLEQRLLDAAVLRIDYEIVAEGAITAQLAGDLLAQKPALAAIRAGGRFDGRAVELQLVSDGSRVRGGSAVHRFERQLPPALHEGLLLGLARMGVLHNLAMLSGGAPPDATDGSVRDWVVPQNFAWLDAVETGDPNLRAMRFDIAVGGSPAGEVKLWFDAASGLPVRREQTVHFAAGDMHVSERYRVRTDGIIGPCRFDIDAAGAP